MDPYMPLLGRCKMFSLHREYMTSVPSHTDDTDNPGHTTSSFGQPLAATFPTTKPEKRRRLDEASNSTTGRPVKVQKTQSSPSVMRGLAAVASPEERDHSTPYIIVSGGITIKALILLIDWDHRLNYLSSERKLGVYHMALSGRLHVSYLQGSVAMPLRLRYCYASAARMQRPLRRLLGPLGVLQRECRSLTMPSRLHSRRRRRLRCVSVVSLAYAYTDKNML